MLAPLVPMTGFDPADGLKPVKRSFDFMPRHVRDTGNFSPSRVR